MTVRRRLTISFLVLGIMAFVVGAFGYLQLSRSAKHLTRLTQGNVPCLQLAEEIRITMLMHRRYEKDFLLNIGKPDKQQTYLAKFTKQSNLMTESIARLHELVSDEPHLPQEIKRSVASLSGSFNVYCEGFREVVRALQADATIDSVKGNELMSQHKTAVHDLEAAITTVAETIRKAVDIDSADAQAHARTANVLLLAITGVGLVLTVGICTVMPRSISRRILSDVSDLSDVSVGVMSASKEIAAASQSLAQGATEQAAGLEETASSMEEMASMTKQNADNAQQANGLAQESRTVAEQGIDAI